jgi:DNA-binding LytR/AlgR family response regulator
MPGGMNGVHLARAARQIRPGIAVLLTSGYLGANAALAENEFPLIDKPYQRPVLATKLREVLRADEGSRKRKRRSAG